MSRRSLLLCSLAFATVLVASIGSSDAGRRRKSKWRPAAKPAYRSPAKDPKSQAVAVAQAFMNAYMRKDSNTMILKLMTPSKELGILVKRYQWWRGYGPDELPGAVRPPILFKTLAGSYVPSRYKLLGATPKSGKWDVHVEEAGRCQEETGPYAVTRRRHIILKKVGASWYVDDYVMTENPEEYGFWTDDIFDKMTPIGR